MSTLAILGTLALGLGMASGITMPPQTLLLINQDGRLFMGDPGPGWAPQGEEDTTFRQSFYYHLDDKTPEMSMALVEADCSQEGRWRIRASTTIELTDEVVKQSRQSIMRRDSDWREEDPNLESDHVMDYLGHEVWKNTCLGTSDMGHWECMSPWTTGQLWYAQQQKIRESLEKSSELIDLAALTKDNICRPNVQRLELDVDEKSQDQN